MKTFPFLFVAASLSLAGCATAPGLTDDLPDVSRFRGVNVAPVELVAEAFSAVDPDDRAGLESELRAAMRSGVPSSLLTDENTTGVLRIEVGVTELNPSSPTVNLLTTALLFVPMDAGGVAFEARFYDGANPVPFARTSCRHTSIPLDLKGSFSKYGHARQALHDWAEEVTTNASIRK